MRAVVALIPLALLLAPTAAQAAPNACAAPHLVAGPAVTWGPDLVDNGHVSGLLTNDGGPATDVQVHLGEVGGSRSETTYASLVTVGTGETVGWDARLLDPPPGGGRWTVTGIDAQPAASTVSHAFPVTVTSQTHQTPGVPGELRGTVRNDSGAPAQWGEVSAVFRSADGALAFVAANQTQDFLGGRVLAPGQSAGWNLPIDPAAPAWSSVSLQGEGSELVPTGCSAAPASSHVAAAAVAPALPAHGAATITHAPVLDAPAVVPLAARSPDVVASPAARRVRPEVVAVGHVPAAGHLGLDLAAVALILVIGGLGQAILAGQRLVVREAAEAAEDEARRRAAAR